MDNQKNETRTQRAGGARTSMNAKQQPKTFVEGFNLLKNELATGKPSPSEDPDMLPVGSIRFADSVFQPRTFVGSMSADSDGHKKTLKDAIRNTPDHLLDPVVVWWAGKNWRVLDGHHRLMAYQDLARDKRKPVSVPAVRVKVFRGTLNQAIAHATELNSRDKLAMRPEDKANRAWKLVALDDPTMSRPMIARIAGVSERTVGNMREAHKTMRKDSPEVDPLDMTWKQVKNDMSEIDHDDDWLEQEAAKWSKRFLKEFGPGLGRNPTLLARALEITAQRLPKRLVCEWIHLAGEAVAEMDEESPGWRDPTPF